MTTITNTARNSASVSNVNRVAGDGLIHYCWMFLFTIPVFNAIMTNQARNSASITNQSIS
jgi:hypothetical protein